MNDKVQLLDALGKDIQEGSKYGYSVRDACWTRVAVGTATKQHASGRVTLSDINTKRFMYGKETTDHSTATTVTVLSSMLFPIPKEP